ncbi:MAG: aspartate kinase, partial [Spirochaetales bacterium]|nr:aspartate kinase [Spirochaetales bacterium]
MQKRVVKFGGSNLKSREDIKKLVTTVSRYEEPVVIVVSAFFGITNYLTEGLETVRSDQNHVDSMREFLQTMKRETINENIDDPVLAEKVYLQVAERIAQLEKYLLGIHYIGEIPASVEDRVLSYGERLSSLLLTEILKSVGIDAEEQLPESIGLVTDGAFRNATVDFALSEPAVYAALGDGQVYVVPGFYGVSTDGKITLLGRGGSDYSAAAIARCVGAKSLDIWKDVDGYMTADPKIVDHPSKIEKLSYTEAAELSYFGAKILHPRTVEPLLEAGIPIRIFNIENMDPTEAALSEISSDGEVSRSVVKSVTYSDQFAMLKLSGPGVGIKHGVLAGATALLDSGGINIKSVVTAQTVINIYLESYDLDRAYTILREHHDGTVIQVTPYEDLSIVALVGQGITENPNVAEKMITAISQKGIA